MRLILGLGASLLLMSSASRVFAGEEYYLLLFGSQRIPNNPNYSHTFAMFVKVHWNGDGPCPDDAFVEHHTISWLPVNMKVRVDALRPEPGHNFGLDATLEDAYRTDQRVSLWGPYPIQPELFARALARKAELEAGHIRYKANDIGYRSSRVTNCVHAISTIIEGPKLRVASPGWGESGSYFVLREMTPFVLSKEPVDWVGSALGLDDYPIIYRPWRNPQSNAVVGPTLRLLGAERNVRATFGSPR